MFGNFFCENVCFFLFFAVFGWKALFFYAFLCVWALYFYGLPWCCIVSPITEKCKKRGGYKCGQSAFCWGSGILCPVAHLYKNTTSYGLYIFAWGGQGFISLLCVMLNLLHQHHIVPALFCAQPLAQHGALCEASLGEQLYAFAVPLRYVGI